MRNHFRLYNEAYTNFRQAYVLDASRNNFRMRRRVEGKISQKFFQVETSHESSWCLPPENNDLSTQGLGDTRKRKCRRGFAWINDINAEKAVVSTQSKQWYQRRVSSGINAE
eukprot:TRINITY_DN15864_c0_g1_i1.p1 TRINITY_DN15864_c0_g1~~TRINITY_DN15864_c0_g1_i1.p1  ORF type:complete len:112 (+),score=36.15 TRINITY_DN15864_c0_g1_i1:401-736(+)